MQSSLEKIFELKSFKNIIDNIISNEENIIYISPLSGCTKSYFISLAEKLKKQIVVLFPDIQSANEFNVELNVLDLNKNVLNLTEFKPEIIQEVLTEISSKEKFVLISTYDLLNCIIPAKDKLEQKTTKIQTGGELSYNDLVEYLNLLNYQKDKFVEAPGDYSQRGSIIDFWSYSEQNPVRLEFDGDFLESIRYFDPESQRSIEIIENVTLAAPIDTDTVSADSASIFDYLNYPLVLASSYELNNLENQTINPFSGNTEDHVNDKAEQLINEDDFPEDQSRELDEYVNEPIYEKFNYKSKTNVKWILEEEINSDSRIELGFIEPPSINGNYEYLFSVLTDYAEKKFNIIITSENDLQSSRLKDLLLEYRSPSYNGKEDLSELIESGKIKIVTLAVKKGFLCKQTDQNIENGNEKILLLTDYQIFNKPYRTKISTNRKYKKSKSKAFASIKKGDIVVHEDYGIGRYTGLETIKIGDTNQESMKILYNEGGIVYVNLNYLSLVKKYSSNDSANELTPTLSTLGTSDWVNTKHRAKKRIKEAARELIELYAKRKATKGYSFNPDTVWQKELEASFLYEDTPDQDKVTQEVKDDMEAENPMDRLVCGDVGFGKTEVAVRAAFKAVQDGKQTAVLVPTTILAEQHYNTFKDRLEQFPVKVEALSRFQTKKKQTEILKGLNKGNVDVVIGTHRLISKDVSFKELGLLIIDEEHRFGVMAKEKLRAMKLNVDTLTLTATPIPRTLNLSLLGARDLSIIATPPPNRQPIYTQVSVFDVFKIREWILNELRRNGQIYFVHDRVQSIDKLAAYLTKHVPEIKLAIAHGQMRPSELEKVIHGFLNRKFDLLLSTKIIESGIDIPNVNTIIVNRADRFGLAELHQLRGRVGRSNRQAYAYFIVPSLNGINKKALRRLQAIEEFTEVGAGFNISMRDLEIRGAGNLLGTEQSGFINDVGFDLYIKLINEAVEELKYQEFKEVFKNLPKHEERTEPTIDTFFEIGIPETYMPEQTDRLNFYTALYSIKNLEEFEELKEEMIDRFGPMPLLVKRLITAALLKFYASYALFERVIIQRKNIFLILPRGEKEDYYKVKFIVLMRFIMDNYKAKVKFNQQKEVMKLVIANNFRTPEDLLEFLVSFSKEIVNLSNKNILQNNLAEESA